jgi:GT2 family glycosyltransferase
VEFNDVDLCLRMKLLGLRIVYTPFAELTHREKASRGEAPAAADQVAMFLNRWRDFLADDPAYHPNLTRDRFAPASVEP